MVFVPVADPARGPVGQEMLRAETANVSWGLDVYGVLNNNNNIFPSPLLCEQIFTSIDMPTLLSLSLRRSGLSIVIES